jgi:magnesium transporter
MDPQQQPPSPEFLYLLAGDPAELAETVASVRDADIAEALNALPPQAAARVLAALPFDQAVNVLDEPELDQEAEIFAVLDQGTAAALIEGMSADQRVDLFRVLEPDDRARLIRTLEPETARALAALLKYPRESAGGIMTTELLSVPADWTVDQALKHVADVGRAKETVYAIYVHEPRSRKLVHVASLRELMVSDRAQPVVKVGDRRRPITVTPLTDREEVARLISKYNLLAVPVVDEAGVAIGIVTVDDVIDAIVAEQTEDVQKFGGMEALDEPYTQIGFVKMMRKRAGWLCILFVSEMLTATAMQHFQVELERATLLAMFIPLVMSSGGNSGSQATSLIIRSLALRELRLRDWWRVALRELPTGLSLGAILGIIGLARITLWQHLGLYDYGPHYMLVATTVGLSLVGIVGFGSLAGSMLPFLLKRLGFDPASASAPFVATLVDVSGLIIYFSVAYAILHGTLL